MLRSISSSLMRTNAQLRYGKTFNFSRLRSLRSISSTFRSSVVPLSVDVNRPLHLSSTRLVDHNVDGIDRTLHRLDGEIRRTGRIARQEIDEVLQDIRDMKKATSSQSLMIIRCCGDLVPSETPENRTKLVQEVLKTMENLNVPMDISHYNAVLRVYLENEHKFNPTEFLQDLSTKGIEPNRVTYQRLIARFCQEGDIDGASTILQHMKEKQLPINEHVFNALINGHARADDMESAEGIIGVMKQAGLEPNDDSYVTLMCGYAKKGDFENIRRIVQDCHEKEIFLIDRDFLNVIYTLCYNGHDNLVDEIIPLLKKHTGFNQDATNLVLRLVNIQKEHIAYRVLKEMTPISRNDEVLPSGHFFIKQLVQSTSSPELVIKYCRILMEDGLNKLALTRACEFALVLKKFNMATDLIEALKESGAPIRQHYFWPFFASSQTEKDIYDGLNCMKFIEIPPTNETLRDYIIPALLKHSQNTSAEKTLEKLSLHTGISMNTIVPAAIQYLLNEKEVDLAAKFASKYRLRFTNPQLRRSIVDAYLKDKNVKTFVRIIGSTGLSGDDRGREIVGIMLKELIESIRPKEVAILLLPVLKELLAHGLGLSNSGSELIQNSLGEELSPEIANLVLQLTSGELTPKVDLYQEQKEAGVKSSFDERTADELEQLLAESISAGRPSKGIKKALLFKYCRERNLEKAEKIHQDLSSEGFVFPMGLQALLLELYSNCDKLDEARQAYSNLTGSLGTPIAIDDLKILRYAHLLLSHDQYKECLDVITNTPRDESRKPLGAVQQATVWKILNILSETGNVEKVQEMFQILRNRNLAPINNVVLGALVKVHLVKDDLDGALTEFERCVKEFNATPWKQELFCRFIKAEDTDRLQRVMDLSTNLHGEVNSMYDLVFAFIQCGKVRQAKKILETPGLKARNDKIERTCQKYLEENRVSELENLIQITKEMVDVDRNAMYFYLLQCYCKAGDSDKALSVWTSLQEENVQASSELLSFLADFLRKNNKPVPFVQPERSKSDHNVNLKLGHVSELRECIDANEIDKALQIKQRVDGEGGKLGLSDLSGLIDKLARAERLGEATRLAEEMFESGMHPHPRTLRFVLGRLAAAGEIDVIKRLSDKLTPDLKRQTMFNTRLSVAYTNAGRGKEYFENYVKADVNKMQSTSKDDEESINITLAGSTYILLRNEDLIGDYEELATVAEQKGSLVLYNTLFIYNLVKKNFNKSKEIWETKLKSEPRVLFRSVMIEARLRKDVEIAKELSTLIMSSTHVSSATKGLASSCVIDVLCNDGKAGEALSYLQDNLKTLQLEDYNPSTLKSLKEKLEAANDKFPFEIPKKNTRGKKPADNNDSDSD